MDLICAGAAGRRLKVFAPEMIGKGTEGIFQGMEHGFNGDPCTVELDGIDGLEEKIGTDENNAPSGSFEEEKSEDALGGLPIQIQETVAYGFLTLIKGGLG